MPVSRDEYSGHVEQCKIAHKGKKKKLGQRVNAVSDAVKKKLAAAEASGDASSLVPVTAGAATVSGQFDPFRNLDVCVRGE